MLDMNAPAIGANGAIPRVRHVLEASLYVSDLDVSEAFYQHVFGFSSIKGDGRFRALAMPGNAVLMLFRIGGSVNPTPTAGDGLIPAHDGSGRQHLGFAILNEALDAWTRHLDTRGIPVESRVAWEQGGTSVYFRDPDGHLLEVATRGVWPTR